MVIYPLNVPCAQQSMGRSPGVDSLLINADGISNIIHEFFHVRFSLLFLSFLIDHGDLNKVLSGARAIESLPDFLDLTEDAILDHTIPHMNTVKNKYHFSEIIFTRQAGHAIPTR
jgi:hypothetical protein